MSFHFSAMLFCARSSLETPQEHDVKKRASMNRDAQRWSNSNILSNTLTTPTHTNQLPQVAVQTSGTEMKMSSKRARLPETSSSAQTVTDEYSVFLAPPTLTRQSNTLYDPNLNPVYDQFLRTVSDCKTHDTSKNSASVAFDVQSTKIHIDTGYESDNSLTGDAYDEKLLKYFSPSPSKLPSTYEYDPRYWIANNESVPVLPSFYPVFRSSISIHKGSARLIAERIKAVLYARSIVAVYDSRGAKADCTTKSNVNFRIRLYQSNKNDAIIVELHRQEGFDLTYQDDMYAIFDAAKGKAHASTQEESPNYITLTDCVSKDEVLNDEDQQTKPSLKSYASSCFRIMVQFQLTMLRLP